MSSTNTHDEGAEELLPVNTVHSFPENYFVENIAVRRSGQLLVTVHNRGELIQVDPHSKSGACLVHKFPTGAAAIVEVEEDVFYVSVGTIGEKGSISIYRVDMSSFAVDASNNITSPAAITNHVPVPDALFLNGSALLSASKGMMLAADSLLGTVFEIDVKSRAVKVWLQHKAWEKTTDDPRLPGINGIKLRNGYLYATNTDARTFLRAGMTGTGEATGSVEQVFDSCLADDFAFDDEGSVYLTTHIFQSVVKIRNDGVRSRIAGGPDDKVVAGTTAAAFGRTASDGTTLYVTTNGGMSDPINGEVGPARILSVDVGHAASG
ncbi:hypothetical protein H2200_003128 [Cladophialophora chaetospira]|uniref:SMP-30/Gluconolactonase/LRE-like region domain-containing protein n=1 Tax=Cladophialophora chaetospira TaxID=386627 RepID=A0AA38XGV2_9EURO|nr:hypothetical protein H2200_003128 [Cladophialophora chaetospira]